MYVGQLASQDTPASRESIHLLAVEYGVWSGLQTVLILFGVAALGYLLYRMSGGHAGKKVLPTIALIAFTLVLIGEVIGRMLFYASMVRVGL